MITIIKREKMIQFSIENWNIDKSVNSTVFLFYQFTTQLIYMYYYCCIKRNDFNINLT